jgi:hypothetical protein
MNSFETIYREQINTEVVFCHLQEIRFLIDEQRKEPKEENRFRND